MKKLLTLLCALFLASAAHAQITSSPSLTINGTTCFLGQSCSIPGSAIASIPNASLTNPSMTINGTTCTLGGSCTPSGGTASAGGATGNFQYNNGGVLGGLKWFDVTAYGAKCDAVVIAAGVSTTSGSRTVSVSGYSHSGQQFTDAYTFNSAQVGDTVVIYQNVQGGSSTSQPTSYTDTIASVSGNTFQVTSLSGVPFTTAPSYGAVSPPPYFSYGGSLIMYKTDDTSAINSANSAALANGGGAIWVPAMCATGQQTLYSNIFWVGHSNGSSGFVLKNGANSDMFVGNNFSSLTGTGSLAGIHDWGLFSLQFNGNWGQNTGSGIGSMTGSGNILRVYGYKWYIENSKFTNFANDAWATEWSSSPGQPGSNYGMEAHVNHVDISNGPGIGMTFNGPHDTVMNNVYIINMGTAPQKVFATGNATPLSMVNYHEYQNGGNGQIYGPNYSCYNCYLETGVTFGQFNYNFTGSRVNNMVLGFAGNASNTVYQLVMNGVNVYGTLTNTTPSGGGIAGSGFNDQWANSIINSIGSGGYQACYVSNTIGLNNVAGCYGSPLQVQAGGTYGSYFGQIYEDASSNMYFANGASVVAMKISPLGAITLPQLASSGTQCLQVSSVGLVTGTGAGCGSGGGGGGISGSGTTGAIPLFSGSTALGNSALTDNGTVISAAESINISPVSSGGNNRTIDFGNGYGVPALLLYHNGSNQWGWGLNGGEMQFFAQTGSGNHISWNNGATLNPVGTNEIMRLTMDTGRLGIGTTSPAAQLDVNGNAAVRGYLYETYNSSGTYPSTTIAGLAVGTNFSNGNAEINLVNANTAAANQSFVFSQMTGSSAKTDLAALSPAGIWSANGFAIGATAGVSCAANTVSLTTFVVNHGIVTHC